MSSLPHTWIKSPTKTPSARLWPSRDFTLGYSLQGLEDTFTSPVKVVGGELIDIGLSNRLNSHTNPESASEDPVKRARRGQKGLSPHGRLLVKNAAAFLEKRYGRDHLSFCTVTLPAVTVEECRLISLQWPEIVRRFQQSIVRELRRLDLPHVVVGVTEIQTRRFERDGVLGLHLHLVFVGRLPGRDWAIHYLRIREMWRRSFPIEFQSKSFKSTENVVRVKRSVAAYLSKYLSKGLSVSDDTPQSEYYRDVLPTSWYLCSLELRRTIKRLVMSGRGVSEFMALIVERAEPDALEFLMPIHVTIDGYTFLAGWRGKLTKEAYRYIYGGGAPSVNFVGETFPQGFEPGKFSGF